MELAENGKLQNPFSFDKLALNMLMIHSALLIAYYFDSLLRYNCSENSEKVCIDLCVVRVMGNIPSKATFHENNSWENFQ